MARVYSEEDRARAYVIFVSNNENVKRTSRDTGVPEGTLRGWMRSWAAGEIPDTQEVAIVAGEFVEDASRVRDKALIELERKIPDATPSALVATVGMLTDKINLTKGLATSRTETVHALPPAQDIAEVLGAALQRALQAAQERDMEIIDAEITALPPAS